jgi:hypothetical protein
MYRTLRTLHLLLASFSLPLLAMYGVSAVQMTHNGWFDMKPTVHESRVSLPPGIADARTVARGVMDRLRDVDGELTSVQLSDTAVSLRLVVPGTVHEVRYDRASGVAHVKTSVAGFMGMLNRLHHFAGLWHEPVLLKIWGLVVFLVSLCLVLLGVSGMYMWFLRRSERRVGVVLLVVDVVFVVVVLGMMRAR